MPKPFQHLKLARNRVAKFTYDAFGRTVSQTGSKAGIDINALSYRFSTKPMELELATANTRLVSVTSYRKYGFFNAYHVPYTNIKSGTVRNTIGFPGTYINVQ